MKKNHDDIWAGEIGQTVELDPKALFGGEYIVIDQNPKPQPVMVSYKLYKELEQAVKDGAELPPYPFTCSAEVQIFLHEWNASKK